ncbi:MAG: hypothetical protein LBT74_01585 [Acidobacteriota bacterium]|nr:hypothetical protein [Acidobacteriota bacterium]
MATMLFSLKRSIQQYLIPYMEEVTGPLTEKELELIDTDLNTENIDYAVHTVQRSRRLTDAASRLSEFRRFRQADRTRAA